MRSAFQQRCSSQMHEQLRPAAEPVSISWRNSTPCRPGRIRACHSVNSMSRTTCLSRRTRLAITRYVRHNHVCGCLWVKTTFRVECRFYGLAVLRRLVLHLRTRCQFRIMGRYEVKLTRRIRYYRVEKLAAPPWVLVTSKVHRSMIFCDMPYCAAARMIPGVLPTLHSAPTW